MADSFTDFAQLREALRSLSRGNLLIIAERAVELVSKEKLDVLLRDIFRVDALNEAPSPTPSLLEAVSTFHRDCVGGKYHDSVLANSKDDAKRSKGTDAFVAEFDRLLRRCIYEGKSTVPSIVVCEAFEQLFDLLRRIDAGNDGIVLGRGGIVAAGH